MKISEEPTGLAQDVDHAEVDDDLRPPHHRDEILRVAPRQQDGEEEDIEHLLRLAKEEVRSRISEHQQPKRLGKPEVRSRVRSHLQTLGDPEAAADIADARIDEVFERYDLDGSGGISEEDCEGLVRHLLSNTRLSF